MLKSLVGCHSIEKILLYLLVNETCYASQLHRLLHTPLTPIQKALIRLENGGILTSDYEGKIRIYQFNPNYPLLKELESLLTKVFTLLSPLEKKNYYYLKYASNCERKQQHELLRLIWDQLKMISNVALVAKSHSKSMNRWIRKGNGSVQVREENNKLIFTEQGQWKEGQGQTHNYSNRFCWTWNRLEGMLSLEHLRFGENHPIFLFHLIPTENNLLESLHSHLCGEDTYFGWLNFNSLFLQLKFRTIGPKKNEELEYVYT
jgi:hypothetical protein